MSHTHDVYDTDAHYVIDPASRMAVGGKTVVVQRDHNSELISFEMPRYIDGHDMSACDLVQIHFLNIDSSVRNTQQSGVYTVKDVEISADGESVTFTWLISSDATQYAGALNFVVRFECATINGSLGYAWSTEVCSAITVASGLYFGE